jgi:hypothetical protein
MNIKNLKWILYQQELLQKIRSLSALAAIFFKLFIAINTIFLISCKSSGSSPFSIARYNSSPEKTFQIINRAIVEGDMETVYKYLSTNQRSIFTLEELKANYQRLKDIWIAQARNARILHLAIDEKEGRASAVIEWGLGDTTLATFILEDGVWKEDTFILLRK